MFSDLSTNDVILVKFRTISTVQTLNPVEFHESEDTIAVRSTRYHVHARGDDGLTRENVRWNKEFVNILNTI